MSRLGDAFGLWPGTNTPISLPTPTSGTGTVPDALPDWYLCNMGDAAACARLEPAGTIPPLGPGAIIEPIPPLPPPPPPPVVVPPPIIPTGGPTVPFHEEWIEDLIPDWLEPFIPGFQPPGTVPPIAPPIVLPPGGLPVTPSYPTMPAGCSTASPVYKKVCGQYKWVHQKRRRRKQLVSRSDLRGLAALKGILGTGKAFEVWIATHA